MEYLTMTEVAQKLGVSDETVRRWLNQGLIRAYQFGKQWRVKPADLEDFIAKSGNRIKTGG